MKRKKVIGIMILCAMLISSLGISAGAAADISQGEASDMVVRASGKFSMDVPANTIAKAGSSFPLEAGETVTIKASYSPFSASVDFGLIAPDGLFYSMPGSDGGFDETIRVDERGQYTFAVKNNSSKTVSVSGFVNY